MGKDLLTYKFIMQLKELPFVDGIWLFGSRARGDNQERSDIDLAIDCPQATNENWQQIMEIIEQADSLLKIDCVRYDKLSKNDKLKENILRFRKILYQKGVNMVDFYWKDYFDTLGQAISRLSDVLHHLDIDKNEYLRDAAIQRFEFVIELFWKVLKKILAYEKVDANSPRDVLSKAYQFQLIDNEGVWLKMLEDRNNTSHAYKEEYAKEVFENIKTYLPFFEKTYQQLKKKYRL